MLAFGLFITQLSENPSFFFAVIITVVISITLHELAHGIVAVKLGDDTPIVTGHMTLNPLVHMGIFSIILLFLVGIAFGAMPVDRTRLRGKYAEALVALAGPIANLLLGILATVALGLCFRFELFAAGNPVHERAELLLRVFGLMNFALMLFNLLPIPPLDGSLIAANLSPAYRRWMSSELAQGAMQALFFAMFLGGAVFVFKAADIGFVHLNNLVAGRPIFGL